jgi:hypothetical protein
MLLVALTRWASAPSSELLAAEVAALSPLLGGGAYELRLALSGPLPVVLLESPAEEAARSVLASLRSRGHGAVACDAGSITPSEQMYQPKTFRFEPGALVLERPGSEPYPLPLGDLLGSFVAVHAQDQESTSERREKKLSLGRAVMTGGLVRSRSTTVTERDASRETERVLYLLRRSGSGHALLRETRLHYGGLGPRMGKGTMESFTTLVGALREAAPQALFDDRLQKPRPTTSFRVTRTSASTTAAASNERAVDVAVHLLAVATLQGQL